MRRAACPLPEVPKNTSGEVHVETARRMCVVRKDSPTWYAAGERIESALDHLEAAGRTIHPPKALPRDHLEVDALVPVLRVDEVRKLHGVKLR